MKKRGGKFTPSLFKWVRSAAGGSEYLALWAFLSSFSVPALMLPRLCSTFAVSPQLMALLYHDSVIFQLTLCIKISLYLGAICTIDIVIFM